MGTVRELKQVDGGWELTVEASTVLEDVKVSVLALLLKRFSGGLTANLEVKMLML